MTSELVTLLDNNEVGRVFRDRRGKLSFVYSEHWRAERNAYPISLSMPLVSTEYGDERIDPFLWGLLPDNQTIIEKWAQRFHVSAHNAFGLIANVGEDCAGAIQFVRPERLDLVLNGARSEVKWLVEHEIAERLRILTKDVAAWRIERDTGQFSLAGAQPKTAFVLKNGRWGVPSGRVPTTHIFKPPIPDLDGHAENEHFCLRLAAKLGFIVPESSVMSFEDQIVIVIKRYDRVVTHSGIIRIHQEDMCQAFGISPAKKYQAEGGPGAKQVITLLQKYSINPLEDTESFVNALALNWLIGGTDGHAKNYSVLIADGTDVRLAPLYDIASVLAYRGFNPHKIRLAMKVGSHYRLREIGRNQWEKFARELNLNANELIARITSFAEAMPDYVVTIRDQLHSERLKHPLIDRLATALIARARACLQILNLKTASFSGS